MLRHLRLLFLIVLAWGQFAGAMSPEKVGLHLSFEQRLALTYALMAQGEQGDRKAEFLDRAKAYFAAVYQNKVQTVKVKNFSEFLNLHKGAWPDTHSVDLDLKMIEARGVRPVMVFEAESPRIQKQIDAYLTWQQEQLKALVPQDQVSQKFSMETIATQVLPRLNSPEGQKSLETWALAESDAILTEKMKELDRVGEKIAESKLAMQGDVTMRIFLQTMFSEYFSRLSPASKKLIVSSFLGSDLNMPDIKKFELMVQNSGPQLQKLLQVVARQADLPPEMLEVFRNLESSVRPVPWEQVEQMVKNEKANYKFLYFERKALGVGTMAQVHRAKIELDGQKQDVVVRFIKPGIADRVEEDKRILTEVAKILDGNPEFRKTGAPKLAPVIQDITSTVVAELSQEDTIARQKLAMLRYEKSAFIKTSEYKNVLQFHVPKIYEGTGKSNFMVQEMVIGRKLDKEVALYAELAPGLKKAIVENLARMWAHEVMFGGGFYHSDLHQGNFMIRVTDPAVTVNILDFGMGGVISKEMQRQVMVLGAGTQILNADLIGKSFWAISDRHSNSLTEVQFRSLVAAKVSAIRAGSQEELTMERWTAWAMDSGLKLPYEFVSLNRGIVIVNKLLADSGSALTMTSLMKALAKVNPVKVYKNLVLEEKVTHKDLIKLGWLEMKDMLGIEKPTLSHSPAVMRCEAVF